MRPRFRSILKRSLSLPSAMRFCSPASAFSILATKRHRMAFSFSFRPAVRQDIGLFSAGNPDLFDLHFWSDLFEIILEQFLFELLELAAWRAHQILSAAFAYGYQVLFTHHSAVKDPYSPCFPMLTLHRAQDRFDGGNIGAVSIE